MWTLCGYKMVDIMWLQDVTSWCFTVILSAEGWQYGYKPNNYAFFDKNMVDDMTVWRYDDMEINTSIYLYRGKFLLL